MNNHFDRMTAPLAIVESAPTREEAHIKALWEAFREADEERTERGLEFGRALHELRERSEVVQGGTSFNRTLDALNIPRRTAYYWITHYEESIGLRELPPTPVVTPQPVVAAPTVVGGGSGHGTDQPADQPATGTAARAATTTTRPEKSEAPDLEEELAKLRRHFTASQIFDALILDHGDVEVCKFAFGDKEDMTPDAAISKIDLALGYVVGRVWPRNHNFDQLIDFLQSRFIKRLEWENRRSAL